MSGTEQNNQNTQQAPKPAGKKRGPKPKLKTAGADTKAPVEAKPEVSQEAAGAQTHSAPPPTEAPKEVITTSADLRGKGADKDIRAPIGEEAATNKMSQGDKIRMATGKQLNLDASFYERLPKYQSMQLFYENDENGAVERWLHIGAELVPRQSKSLKEFKGFTDRATSEWECTPVGTDATGKPLLCYLLFMPAEDYQTLRVAPKENRNAEILGALGMGKSQAEGAVMPNVKGIKTYAPNNPVGEGRGFEQTHDA
jgi:hypothetical protein